MRKLCIVPLVIFLFALAFLSGDKVLARTYTTNFSLTENPISEGGNWINGQADGRDWLNVRTTGGNAMGFATSGYNDPTALVSGTWGANQTVEATVWISSRPSGWPEVELRLRSSISIGINSGYEILFSINTSSYHQIVRWNGALGDWAYLTLSPSGCGNISQLESGNKIKASISGNTITTYIDRGSGYVQLCTATDSTFSSGKPGIGFYGDSGNTLFGLSDFTASDEADAIPPSSPKNLHIMPQ